MKAKNVSVIDSEGLFCGMLSEIIDDYNYWKVGNNLEIRFVNNNADDFHKVTLNKSCVEKLIGTRSKQVIFLLFIEKYYSNYLDEFENIFYDIDMALDLLSFSKLVHSIEDLKKYTRGLG